MKYIFDDFFRGFYIVGAVFFNGLIASELYFGLPFFSRYFSELLRSGALNETVFGYYMLAVLVIVEIALTMLEMRGFARIWLDGKAEDVKDSIP